MSWICCLYRVIFHGIAEKKVLMGVAHSASFPFEVITAAATSLKESRFTLLHKALEKGAGAAYITLLTDRVQTGADDALGDQRCDLAASLFGSGCMLCIEAASCADDPENTDVHIKCHAALLQKGPRSTILSVSA